MRNKSWCIANIACIAFIVTITASYCSDAWLSPETLERARLGKPQPISINNFEDSIKHALMQYEGGKPPYRRYKQEQSIDIAENLLIWQNQDGGWPKNIDWLKVLNKKDINEIDLFRKSKQNRSSLDNRNTWSQIDYLARVRFDTGIRRYDSSIKRAVDYLLINQNKSGGWCGADVDAITFNDEVMVGAVRTLKRISEDNNLYGFVDDNRRRLAHKAYEKGIKCILKCQVRIGDQLTAWAQQHDHETFLPVWGRRYEMPALTAGESVSVVELLMEINQPDGQIVQAIEAAATWLDAVKIEGLRLRQVPAEPIKFRYKWSNFDRVVVHEQGVPSIWSRFYDLKAQRPVFSTREGKIVRRYEDLTRERRSGYDWYGYWPARFLRTSYPAWRQKTRHLIRE
jgi:PelA/Pel-15E family pectate lyase